MEEEPLRMFSTGIAEKMLKDISCQHNPAFQRVIFIFYLVSFFLSIIFSFIWEKDCAGKWLLFYIDIFSF